MKTLCLGGSFNPIHHGHLICARAVAEAAGYQKLALIPSAWPPHKPRQKDLADASERLHMCRLAIQSLDKDATAASNVTLEVCDVELTRTGLSYTIDTVRALKQMGWPEVHWLIGADMLQLLPKWHEPAALLREAVFVVMARPGVEIDWTSLPAEFAPLRQTIIQVPLIDISSTQIRQRIRAGLSIDYLTPPPVVEYIRKKHLYR